MRTIGDLNEAIDKGYASLLIQISEALQEKKIARIADEIAKRRDTKIVLIAGPSSSGKTTTCKRLSVQLAVNGIKPIGISLDAYFVDRAIKLLNRIEKATGKSISGRDSEETIKEFGQALL